MMAPRTQSVLYTGRMRAQMIVAQVWVTASSRHRTPHVVAGDVAGRELVVLCPTLQFEQSGRSVIVRQDSCT